MPLKELSLVARDLAFFVTGRADVRAAEWRRDPWLYPLDFGFQLDRPDEYFAPFDASGVPLRVFRGALGEQYLPSRIAGYGLAQWNRWRVDANEGRLASFQACADWFFRAKAQLFWHEFSVAGLPTPWLSCIAQGEGASVLARAFVLTGEPGWRDAAYRAVEPMMRPLAHGGLRSTLPDGQPFLEEYPNSQYEHVLNGCLYGIVGLIDVARLAGPNAEEVLQFARELGRAVATHVAHWEWRGWSSYDYARTPDAPRNFNTMTYQILQIELLRYIGAQLNDDALIMIADRWESAAASLRARLAALTGKSIYRLRHRYGSH